MKIVYSKTFLKQFDRLRQEVQEKTTERIKMFLANKHDPLLRYHKLKGSLEGYTSFSITGDWRIQLIETKERLEFVAVGTHSQLYGKRK